MQLEFASGEDGLREARALEQLVQLARDADPADSHQVQLLDLLARTCETRLAGKHAPAAAATGGNWWRRLWGPSRRELMLSEQRNEALARAERAERSAFESLAETARVARERDELKARVAELEPMPGEPSP